MNSFLSKSLFLAWALMFLNVPVRAAVTIQELSAGLSTLQLVEVDLGGKSVTYMPVKPVVVDLQGQAKNSFDVFPISATSILVSGAVALQADKAELSTLQQRAAAALGQGTSIKELQPTSFSVWIISGGKTIFSMPTSSGILRPIPVQVTITKPQNDPKVTATLYAAVTYRESLKPAAVNLIVDWKKLIGELKLRESANRLETKDVEEVAKLSRETGSIKINLMPGGDTTSLDFLLPYIKSAIERALQPRQDDGLEEAKKSVADIPQDERVRDLALTYSIRSEIENKTGTESISMNTTQTLYRSFVIVQRLTLYP